MLESNWFQVQSLSKPELLFVRGMARGINPCFAPGEIKGSPITKRQIWIRILGLQIWKWQQDSCFQTFKHALTENTHIRVYIQKYIFIDSGFEWKSIWVCVGVHLLVTISCGLGLLFCAVCTNYYNGYEKGTDHFLLESSKPFVVLGIATFTLGISTIILIWRD